VPARRRNETVPHPVFTAWRERSGAVHEVFATDMVWRIEGTSLAAKDYGTAQQFLDEVLSPSARFSASEPFRWTRVAPR
jgi:hypothetical protein